MDLEMKGPRCEIITSISAWARLFIINFYEWVGYTILSLCQI